MTPDQIELLVVAKAPETLRLEFKRDLPNDSKEFAKDVCAMANAAGGTILFGIEEANGCAKSVYGIDCVDVDAEVLRLTQILRSGIEPKLLRFNIRPHVVRTKHVLEIDVHQSLVRPHWVIAGNDHRFHIRHNSGKALMSLDEIRDAFVSGGLMLERALEWRASRVSDVAKDNALDHGKVWMIFHLCPLSALSAGGPRLDPAAQQFPREHELRTPSDFGGGRPNYLGWRIEGQDRESRIYDYVQVFRDFRFEVVFRAGEHDERLQAKTLWAGVNESHLGKWLKHFHAWATHFDFPYPAYAFLSVINTRGTWVSVNYKKYQAAEPVLLLEPTFVSDSDFAPISLMKPAYDHLYQAYGLANCPFFEANGNWKKDVPLG